MDGSLNLLTNVDDLNNIGVAQSHIQVKASGKSGKDTVFGE